jgi:hypothetical protein
MTASAHPFNQSECYEFATHAYVTAVYRDRGIPLEETAKSYIAEYVSDLPKDTYLKDQDDFNQVIEMMNRVYYSPQIPEVVAEQEYAACIQRTKDSEV